MNKEIDPHKYLCYLAETDEQYAQARTSVKAAEHRLKAIKAKEFLIHKGAQAEREQVALASHGYQLVLDELNDVTLIAETMAAKRKTAELCIDVWRSLNSARKQAGGNL